MKHLMRWCACAFAAGMTSLMCVFSAFAGEAAGNGDTVALVVDSDYISGKVNDPVSKKSLSGFIICDNATFHLEAVGPDSTVDSAQIVFYINEYVDGQDQGARTRVLMKDLPMNEQSTMLPEDTYSEQLEEGAAFDFINRCYSVRVYMDEAQTVYRDYYFGLVDEMTYDRMAEETAKKQEAAARKEAQAAQYA